MLPRAERGRAFSMPSADARNHVAQVPTPIGEQDYKIKADLATRAATLRERRPMKHYIFFRDWSTLCHSGSRRRTVRIDSAQYVNRRSDSKTIVKD